MADHWLVNAVALGFAGFGLGIGLVVGAFAARMLRRWMKEDRDE